MASGDWCYSVVRCVSMSLGTNIALGYNAQPQILGHQQATQFQLLLLKQGWDSVVAIAVGTHLYSHVWSK